MECRLRATPDQFMILLKFMESNGDLGRPQPGLQSRVKADRLWQQLGKLLNSSSGGVIKAVEKWKKVWADWKAKTKKKAITIRRAATSGGPASKIRLTAPEKRLLAIMGIKSVLGPVKTEKEDIQEPIKRDPLSPSTRDTAHSDYTSYSATDDANLDFIPIYSIESSTTVTPPPSEISRHPSPQVSTPPPDRISEIPPPNATTTRRVIRRWRPINRMRVLPTSAMRRQRLNSAREKPAFQQNSNDFATIEVARLQLEVEREKNNHQREMERLRLENRRIEMEEHRNETMNRLVGVLESLTEILPQLRPSLLPSNEP